MTIRKVEIERLTMISSKPFDAVVAAVEDAIGRPDMREFEKSHLQAPPPTPVNLRLSCGGA